MRTLLCTLLVLGTTSVAFGIIRRDDVDDTSYVVDAAAYPAVVDLLEPGDCLATLITPRWAISAAHCVEGLELPHALRFGDRSVEVLRTVSNENFDGESHDIVLIQLAEPVLDVEPIELYRGEDELAQRVILVGRGDTATGLAGQSGATLDLLTRRATNTVASVDELWIRFTFNAPGDEEVTDLEGISGDGDSGGPAFIETSAGLQLAGLSAYQDASDDELGTYGVTEVYTRVSQYQDFVDGVTGADSNEGGDEGADACSVRAAGLGSLSNTRLVLLLIAALVMYRRRLC